MTQTEHTDLILIAAEFVELMRSDFGRSFRLKDFVNYAHFEFGPDVDDGDVERVAYHYFGKHYDLVRWDIGTGWSFIPELAAPEPPEQP